MAMDLSHDSLAALEAPAFSDSPALDVSYTSSDFSVVPPTQAAAVEVPPDPGNGDPPLSASLISESIMVDSSLPDSSMVDSSIPDPSLVDPVTPDPSLLMDSLNSDSTMVDSLPSDPSPMDPVISDPSQLLASLNSDPSRLLDKDRVPAILEILAKGCKLPHVTAFDDKLFPLIVQLTPGRELPCPTCKRPVVKHHTCKSGVLVMRQYGCYGKNQFCKTNVNLSAVMKSALAHSEVPEGFEALMNCIADQYTKFRTLTKLINDIRAAVIPQDIAEALLSLSNGDPKAVVKAYKDQEASAPVNSFLGNALRSRNGTLPGTPTKIAVEAALAKKRPRSSSTPEKLMGTVTASQDEISQPNTPLFYAQSRQSRPSRKKTKEMPITSFFKIGSSLPAGSASNAGPKGKQPMANTSPLIGDDHLDFPALASASPPPPAIPLSPAIPPLLSPAVSEGNASVPATVLASTNPESCSTSIQPASNGSSYTGDWANMPPEWGGPPEIPMSWTGETSYPQQPPARVSFGTGRDRGRGNYGGTKSRSTHSYSQVAKAPAKVNLSISAENLRSKAPAVPKKDWTKIAKKAFNIKPVQTEFKRIHARVNGIVFKNCDDHAEIVAGLIKSLGLQKDITLASKIGNSILEFYVAIPAVPKVIKALQSQDILLDAFDPSERPPHAKSTSAACQAALVKRLTYLYKKARFVKLKECILDGFNDEIQSSVQAKLEKSPEVQTR